MKKVMVFGTFDLLHPGHIHMLKEAMGYGDCLIAVVARDSTAEQVKGKKPLNNQETRIKNLKALGLADKILLGYEGDKHRIAAEEQPQVVALGYDQNFFIDGLKKVLPFDARIIRLSPYLPEKYKSSKLAPNQG